MSQYKRRNVLYGLLFASPWLLRLVLFIVYPVFASGYYSFTNYSPLNTEGVSFLGFKNYTDLILKDEVFGICLYNTLYYTLLAVPIQIIVGVGMAMMLNVKIRGRAVYRTIYFLPTLVPSVALGVLWMWVFNAQYGVVNTLLWQLFRIDGPGWLTNPSWTKPTIILISMWTVGQPVVTYLAALQDVPQSLYDAAEVDGANALQRIRYVTIPSITPVIFFNLIMGFINAWKFFEVPYVVTGSDGHPARSLLFYTMYLYNNAFHFLKMGRASAMAWILLVIVLISTLVLFRTSARWVYYGGEEA